MTRSHRPAPVRMAAALIAATLLSACGVSTLLDSKQPVDTIYVLSPPPSAAGAQSIAADLAVANPRVAPGLAGERIAVLKGRELNYYYGARWGAELSQLVQSFVVRTLSGQGAFRSVASEDTRAASSYSLTIEVTHFQAEYADATAPHVRVAFIGRLLRVSDRTLVNTLASEASVPAASNRMSEVIAAFEQAARTASSELAEKVADAARSDVADGKAG
ncbi:MAG: ABC-type transport auxiliary lipoprotein family protein [Steroidobacteraceae bacterium]